MWTARRWMTERLVGQKVVHRDKNDAQRGRKACYPFRRPDGSYHRRGHHLPHQPDLCHSQSRVSALALSPFLSQLFYAHFHLVQSPFTIQILAPSRRVYPISTLLSAAHSAYQDRTPSTSRATTPGGILICGPPSPAEQYTLSLACYSSCRTLAGFYYGAQYAKCHMSLLRGLAVSPVNSYSLSRKSL